MTYVELHAKSAFSFLEGASVPEELIAACAELKMPAMALLDRDGVYGAPRFHMAAKKNGIKAHIGAEITVQRPIQRPTSRTSKVQRQKQDVGHWTLDLGQNGSSSQKRYNDHSGVGSQPHWLSKSLSTNHPDETACAEARKTR